jgi:hypothetical protein
MSTLIPKSERRSAMEEAYVREKEAAAFLGVSVSELRSVKGRRSPPRPPFTRIDGMGLYS